MADIPVAALPALVTAALRLLQQAERAELLLEVARQLGETLEPERVYDRFHDLLAGTIQHDGVVVSSYDGELIRCEFAWVEGEHLDPAIFPPLSLGPEGGGMQSEVIRSGRPLLVNDIAQRVERGGTFYNVDREGAVRKIPDEGPPASTAAMMVPIKHEGRVVGVVQLMSDGGTYTSDQLELVEGLVAQMAAAVRNARLHEERRRLETAEAAARALAAEREQAAHVLDAVGDGIFLIDRGGIVRLWNRAAEVVTGVSGDDVCGGPISDVFPMWQAIRERVEVANGGAMPRSVTLPLEFGGNELWLSFAAVQSAEGVVYAFRDLTAERRLEEAKSDFIATVSHELRTPLSAVYGAAVTLLRQDVDLPPAQTRLLLEMIGTQAARLTQIVEDVLLASRLERGELRVERELVDLGQLAAATVDAMRSQLPETISLTLSTVPALGAAAGDVDRLRQVLINLIDNAIKYSPEGGVVTVSLKREGGWGRLSVADEGLGIPSGEQRAIFEKFYRVDPALTHAPGGTGLGLYICRELVERMGGRIDVESEPGVGSIFTVELPLAENIAGAAA
jgi:PAS domain S-box-containing protein